MKSAIIRDSDKRKPNDPENWGVPIFCQLLFEYGSLMGFCWDVSSSAPHITDFHGLGNTGFPATGRPQANSLWYKRWKTTENQQSPNGNKLDFPPKICYHIYCKLDIIGKMGSVEMKK